MQNTTIQVKDKKVNIVSHYYKQYLNNHQGLNMEFTEFMASKLGVSESDAVKVIRSWKKTLITLTENK
tara:strand:- start:315 stop:518 length:204 start_codon:yes stop_codon:yes gene_type:complete